MKYTNEDDGTPRNSRDDASDLKLVPSHMRRLHTRRKALAFALQYSQTQASPAILDCAQTSTACQRKCPGTESRVRSHPQSRPASPSAPAPPSMQSDPRPAVRSSHAFATSPGSDSNRALLPQPVQRFLHRDQISGAVIHDRDHHSTPLVLGNSRAIRRSRQQAARSARANALKSASIL